MNKNVLNLFKQSILKKKQALAEGDRSPQPKASIKDLPTKLRVNIGKQFENEIIQKLKTLGEVQLPSLQQDTRFKLDGFISFTDPRFVCFKQSVAIQIKQRVQTGDDVIFEVRKDFDADIIGRDLLGASEIYVVSNRQGEIGIFRTSLLKELVSNLLLKDTEKLKAFKENEPSVSRSTTSNGLRKGLVSEIDGAQLWVTEGKPVFNEGERKLIAYIPFQIAGPIVIL